MRTDSAASVCPHKLFNVSSSSFRSDLEYTEISTVMLPRFIVGIVCYSNIFLNVILWGGEWLTDSNYITVGGCGGCCSRWECPKILLLAGCGGHSTIEKSYVATRGVCRHHHVVSDCEVGHFGVLGVR